MNDTESKAESIAIAFAYVVTIGLQVYIVADQLTDGDFSRDLSVRLRKWWYKVNAMARLERTIEKDSGKVIFEAMEIVENG